jgi:pimeloyl-ACP methyl ester carboxylesterase
MASKYRSLRTGTAVLLFLFACGGAAHAQNGLLGEETLEGHYQEARGRGTPYVAPNGRTVRPPGPQHSPEAAATLMELEVEAAELRRQGRAGDALRTIARAWAVARGEEPSPRSEFLGSLVLRTDTVVCDPTRPLIGWLSQAFSAARPAGMELTARVRLAAPERAGILEVGPGETVGEPREIADLPADLIAEPVAVSLDAGAVENGIHLFTVEILEGGEPVHRLTRFVHVVQGLDTARADILARLARFRVREESRLSIIYPFEAARYQNLGWEEPRSYDFPKLIAESRRLLEEVEAGREPLYRAMGYHDRHYLFEEAGMIMPYAVYVPTSYDPAHSYPMVVLLHGGFGSPGYMLPRYVPEPTESLGYILAAPMGYSPIGGYGIEMGETPEAERRARLSEKDVLNVIDQVNAEYSVDSDRVFILGHSMGGAGAWHLALSYPDRWAGIVPSACRPPGKDNLKKLLQLPILAITGEGDNPQHLLPLMRQMAADMEELGSPCHRYLEVKDAGHASAGTVLPNLANIFEFFEECGRRGAS